MSKLRNRRSQSESTSFLDIIACGFGAIVLLVLLAKDSPEPSVYDANAATKQLDSLVAEKTKHDEAMSRIRELREQVAKQKSRIEAGDEVVNQAEQSLGDIDRKIAEYQNRLAVAEQTLKQMSEQPEPPAPTPKIENVGGIPVDRKYVVFVIDTSGSMRTIWSRVLSQVGSLMEVHPKMEGFQVLNDNGSHLIPAYTGRWIEDTPARRKSILRAMSGWVAMSGSNPVPGIKGALRTYAKYRKDLSVYVLGDEYSGGSFDPDLRSIMSMNSNSKTKKSLARIHGIGFFNPESPVNDRFSILMREIARQNGGAFVAVAQ